MRRSLAWIAATLALALIAGCSGQPASQPQPGTSTAPQTRSDPAQGNSGSKLVDTSKFKRDRPVKIHWASFWAGSPWMAAMGEHLRQEFAKYPNVTFTYSDGQNKKEKLIADIEDAANKNPDLIIVTAGDAESPRDVVANAVKKGIPVVALQKVINGDEVTAKVFADDVQIGKEQAKSVVEALTKKNGLPKGTYALMTAVAGSSLTNSRLKAYKEVLDQYPDIKKVGDQTNINTRDQARSVMEDWIQRNQNIDVVLGMIDEEAMGAALAVRDAKKVGQYLIVGANAQSEVLQLIKTNEVYNSYWVPDAVDKGVAIAMQILQGEPVPFTTIVDGQMVDKMNVDQALNPKCFVYRGPEHKAHSKHADGC